MKGKRYVEKRYVEKGRGMPRPYGVGFVARANVECGTTTVVGARHASPFFSLAFRAPAYLSPFMLAP